MSDRVYQLVFFGFRERELNALRLLFANHADIAQIVATEKDADIAIVDLDGAEHAALWRKTKQAFTGPVIVVSVRKREYANPERYLPKPYHSDRLIEAIQILGENLPVQKNAGQAVALDLPTHIDEPSAFEAPEPLTQEAAKTTAQPDELELSYPEPIAEEGEENPITLSEFDEVTELDITHAAEIVLQEEGVAEGAPRTDTEDLIPQKMEVLQATRNVVSEPRTSAASTHRKPESQLQPVSSVYAQENLDFGYRLNNDDFQPEGQDNRAYYQPADMLQGVITDVIITARQTHRPVQISGLGEVVYLCPSRNFVRTALQDHRLGTLCRISITLDQLKISLLDEHQAAALISATHGNAESMASFLWKVTVLCARGRIPVGTQIDRPVQLSDSPDLGLPIMPGGEAISRLWRAELVSLRQTPERLRIPYRDVYNFYSACRAVGLIAEHSPVRKGLLGRLFNKHSRNQ